MGFLISRLRGVAVISVILVGAVVVAVILIGSLPSRSTIDGLETRISRLEQRNAVLEQSLKIAELRGAAGLMTYRVNQNDYDAAAERSTGFFNGVREMVSETEDQALRQNLEAMLQQRDEITAGLAQSDPATKEKLAQIYADFFQIRGAG